MDKKIIGIFVVMLMISSALTTILFSDDGTAEASEDVNLDFNYVWLQTQYFANVIHNVNWSENGENGIPKGRSWATAGENYTINEILDFNINGSSTPCGLTGFTKLPIGYVDDDRGIVPGTKYVAKQYSTKIVIHNYNLTLINPGEPDQYIPYTESFPFGLGFLPHNRPLLPFFDIYHRTHFNDSEIPIRFRSLNCEPCPLSNPYAGASPEYYFNIDVMAINDFPAILGGIVEYIEDGQSIPEDQNDTVFLMNESISCETKIQNITESAIGCILIHDQNRNYNFGNADDQNCSFAWVNWTDSNMSLLLNDLKNGSKYFALLDTETQTLNFFNCSCIIEEETPWVGVYDLRNKSNPAGTGQDTIIYYNYKALVYSWLNRDDPCKAIIVAGPLDTHWMLHTVNGWSWFNFKNIFDAPYIDCYWVPMFSVNASVSEWIFDNIQTASISGFLDQDIYEQTRNKPGVISHNVVAYRNISHSPDDKIVVLSNRIDGWFSETPGDSGVGGAILLGIAKYLKDNDITPKYNLTFLFTTGEEYGMRGAQHFIDTHPSGTDEGEYNYIHWIGFDQLGFNLTGDGNKLQTEIKTQNESRLVIRAIANDTDYKNKTNNFYDFCVNYSSGGGAEDFVWKNNCLNTILFEKDRGWNGWHCTGDNYNEGDSLTYIDRNDVNVTFELAWNITKYFCVNPDCSFNEDVSYSTFDSPNDGDTLPDTVQAEFSIDSILPSDKVMVNATLRDQNDNGTAVAWKVVDYTITTLNPSNPSYNITIAIPDEFAQGEYTLQLRLYNSTGRINISIDPYDDVPNEIQESDPFNLYHPLGNPTPGRLAHSTEDIIRGSYFTANEYGTARNITAYVQTNTSGPSIHSVCMIYRKNDSKLIGSTVEILPATGPTPQWRTYNFTTPYPILEENIEYVLVCWSDGLCNLYYDHIPYTTQGRYDSQTYGVPPDPATFSFDTSYYSIYCGYQNDSTPPLITNITAEPHLIGFGGNVTLSVDVTDNVSGVNTVTVNIGYPGGKAENKTMTLISGDIYQYVFNNTWLVGQYNYTIWTTDNANNTSNHSDNHKFYVSTDATISIATLQDSYSGNQYINITDPPENLTVVNRGSTWNTYYNATTGENILEAYQAPVNYQEDNGTWIPINNTVSPLSENHPAYVYGYRSGNNRGLYGVYFKSNAQLDWPVAFTYNKSDDPTVHAIRSKLMGVGYVDPQNDWAYEFLQNVASSQGQINDYSIMYQDAFTGTDITWSYGNTGLKEEIILSNTTKTMLQNHPPSQYGLNDTSSYLVFITKLDYQNLNLYNDSEPLQGNVTISDEGIEFRDVLGQFKCALPLGEAYELNNESNRENLTYRIVHLNGNTYLLSGLKVSNLNAMTFPVVIDPTLTVYSTASDGHVYNSGISYTTVQAASTGTVSGSGTYLTIGQRKIYFPDTYYVYRGFVFFNTSALPSNAYLEDATLSLYKKDDYSTTDFDITIQNGQPTYPRNPMQSGDYNKNYYSGNGGTLSTSGFTNGYNAIRMNNLSWINKTGITKLCLRSSRDISGTAPTGSEYVNVYSNEFLGMNPPRLVINYRNQSKIKNAGSTDIKGYLLIQVQFYNSTLGKWCVDNDTINETATRTIISGDQLALDTIFNGHVRASDLTNGTGTYRVYVAFRDPEGNILWTDDDVDLEAWWQFNKT